MSLSQETEKGKMVKIAKYDLRICNYKTCRLNRKRGDFKDTPRCVFDQLKKTHPIMQCTFLVKSLCLTHGRRFIQFNIQLFTFKNSRIKHGHDYYFDDNNSGFFHAH